MSAAKQISQQRKIDRAKGRLCSVVGCDEPWCASDLCSSHYYKQLRAKRAGREIDLKVEPKPKLTLVKPKAKRATALQRFESRVQVLPNGCHQWTGPLKKGYPDFSVDGRTVRGHRWIYEKVNGPIPDGLEIDHVCHSRDLDCSGGESDPHRACVNPEHLEAVLPEVNWERGRARTHCANNHLLSPANVTYDANAKRLCRVCERAKDRLKALGRWRQSSVKVQTLIDRADDRLALMFHGDESSIGHGEPTVFACTMCDQIKAALLDP